MKDLVIIKRLKSVFGAVLVSYLVSLVLLLFIALVAYTTHANEKVISGMVIGNYFLSCLAGGIVAGKSAFNRKFLWGIVSGIVYALIIVIVSIMLSGGDSSLKCIIIVTLLSSLGGMTGGMVS